MSPLASPSRSTGPVLRLTYPGIKKLVIIYSYLNRTRAGIIALNTVAAYNSALATATTDGGLEPARRLASSSCVECGFDLTRIQAFIARRQTVVLADGEPNRWVSIALFISSVTPEGHVLIAFDGLDSAVQLRSKDGGVLAHQSGSLESDNEMVATIGAPKIVSIGSR